MSLHISRERALALLTPATPKSGLVLYPTDERGVVTIPARGGWFLANGAPYNLRPVPVIRPVARARGGRTRYHPDPPFSIGVRQMDPRGSIW